MPEDLPQNTEAEVVVDSDLSDGDVVLSSDSDLENDVMGSWPYSSNKYMRPSCVLYSATDNASLCQRVLLGHPHCSKPMHIFADVLERLPAPVLERCKAIEAAKLEAAKAIDPLLVDDVQRQKERLGMALVRELCAELETVHFQDRAWCLVHNCYCSLHPYSDPS